MNQIISSIHNSKKELQKRITQACMSPPMTRQPHASNLQTCTFTDVITDGTTRSVRLVVLTG
uniref:Uncharacterized protein n=1 Tax=Anguilla anguilla TaxID=7936 RepID=A0A0E9WMC4_ANGAN